jgi:hypothetical protein
MSRPEMPSDRPLPVETLDYEPPQRRPSRLRELLLGLAISLLMAIGVGCLAFGILTSHGEMRDDQATVTSAGLTLITLAICLVGLIFFLRRLRH